jgi:hypothetical protein
LAFIAGFSFRRNILAVYGFGQYPGTGSFTHSPWSAKQEGVCQLIIPDRIFQGCGNVALPHYRFKSLGSILSGRNNEFVVHTGAAKLWNNQIAELPVSMMCINKLKRIT